MRVEVEDWSAKNRVCHVHDRFRSFAKNGCPALGHGRVQRVTSLTAAYRVKTSTGRTIPLCYSQLLYGLFPGAMLHRVTQLVNPRAFVRQHRSRPTTTSSTNSYRSRIS